MQEKIHTIPVVESFEAGQECPFCHLERDTDQRAIRYFAGPSASYMEPGIRGITNREGFCPGHLKKLYDYGNPLGAALMMQTHCEDILLELHQQLENYEIPQKKSIFNRKKQENTPDYPAHLMERVGRCAICDQVEDNMNRQYRVFFTLLKEPEFRQMIEGCKGFCLPHFARLLQEAKAHLASADAKWFYDTVYPVMEENLTRVKEDLDWLIAKYDYRNAGADWKNSKDALQRMAQKLGGGYVADGPYRKD